MSMIGFVRASLIGSALAIFPTLDAQAQALRVVEGQTSATLSVPMNRAVVVESDLLFAEISVANPAIADIATLSERSIYVLGRTPGRTTMTMLGPDGALIANIEVQVVPDVAELRERLREILRGENIEVRTANDGIVLSGTVTSGRVVERAMELAERYAPGRVSNLMLVGGSQQVMLQVRFAEMSRRISQQLGINMSLSGASGGTSVGFNTLGDASAALTAPANGGVLGAGATIGGDFQFNILLEALETEGLVRTLAEPNLTALSGQSADFLAGGEFPVPVNNDGNVTVEYVPFGLQLEFTPTVVDDDIINLVLNASVSSIDASLDGLVAPGLRTREASTVVEMRDGESFAIAGLLQDDFRDNINRVPWLGDLPVLGLLFRSANYQREQSELVIIVTAHLVSPVRGEALALPTDRVAIPTENELFFQGRLAGSGPRAGTAAADVARQDFTGSYGYVMD